MTDIALSTYTVLAENLSWDLSNPGVPYDEGATLNVALFTAAQHYPNGYIPAGTLLGKVTATGYVGPYLDAASDGRQTCVGILKASVQATQPNTGTAKTLIGVAVRKAFAVVSIAKLPLVVGTAAAGGYYDAAAAADLPRIHFTA